MWFASLLRQDTRDLIELALGAPMTAGVLQEAVGHDLAVTGLAPKLFLPNLSGLMQGPGFPSLSCLGLLSDRVLAARYAPRSSARRTDEHLRDAVS